METTTRRCPYFAPSRIAIVALITCVCFSVSGNLLASAAEDPWVVLQRKGAHITKIVIKVNNVFDLSKPDENNWLGRAANFVHITTRRSVIRQIILFAPGDTVDARVIHESERLLRKLPFVRDADIVPGVSSGGVVTARVMVRDAWSIEGGITLHHAGGQNSWRVRADEKNFLGLGKQLLVSRDKNHERTTNEFAYGDPQLFGSRWTLLADYRDMSDGTGTIFRIRRPFYSLDTPWAVTFSASRTQFHETLYNEGHAVYDFPSIIENVNAYAGFAYRREVRSSLRLGLEFRATTDSYGKLVTYRRGFLPEPLLAKRRYRGFLLHWQFLQDRYSTFENLASIDRVEDFNLGWNLNVAAGYFLESLGSIENASYAEVALNKGFAAGKYGLFLWNLKSHGRRNGGRFEDLLAQTQLSYYDQRFAYQTLAFNLNLAAGNRLDPEEMLYLGGDEGLRGYTNHFQAGDRKWLLSIEDRVVTPWSLWGLVRVGFAGFADVGAVRDFRTGRMSRTYADVGVGLRFGNLRSAFGHIIFLGVAVPLVKEPGVDKYQIVVGNVVRF